MKDDSSGKKGVLLVRMALSLFATGMLLTGSLHGQEVSANNPIQKVEVTGSNLKHIEAEGPSAVVVVRRIDIERSGAGTVVELLGKMTGVTGAFDGTNSNSFSQGAAAVSLRGLGEKNTLVLLNGRRIANYGYAQNTDSTFVDLNSIPLSALERVEVLRDGASAIYGSDAVAGVINFITRRNYEGIEASARVAGNQAGDAKETSVGITAGFGNLSTDKQNVLLSFDAFHRDPTQNGKHSLTRSDDRRPYGGTDGRSTDLYPGSFFALG